MEEDGRYAVIRQAARGFKRCTQHLARAKVRLLLGAALWAAFSLPTFALLSTHLTSSFAEPSNSAVTSETETVPEVQAPSPLPQASSSTNVVRFGFLKPMFVYGKNNYQPGETDLRRPLESYLQRALPDVHFEFVEYPLPELGRAAREHRIDFALMSAGQYVEVQNSGAYALATVSTARFPDPNRFTAALFVVSSRLPQVKQLEDMRGLRAAFNSRANFINYQIPLGEVAQHGFDPDNFFRQQLFTNDHPEEVLRLIMEDRADVGVFRICEYEALMRMKPEFRLVVHPAALKEDTQLACLRSTELFPGWTVVVTSSKDSNMTTRLANALLMMPQDPSNGMRWRIATEFNRVNEVFRLIKAGPYEHLRAWTLSRIWETYWQFVVTGAVIVALWVAHWLSVERLAEARARELSDAYVRQRMIEDKAIKAEERLAAMSRLGVVSQLSSIFAHEMGQPLSAIRYRVKALESLLAAPAGREEMIMSSLKVIASQGEKAARILQKVRDYAKGATNRAAEVRLDLLVENTIADLKRSKPTDVNFVTKLEPITVTGDELELGLAVLNILKNAVEAADARSAGRIFVQLAKREARARLLCENSGLPIDREKLAEHMTPMSTSKEEGIGLGLIIINSIAEAHGGTFSLTPRKRGGACAVMELPIKRVAEITSGG